MIATQTQVKSILNISDSTYDSQIDTLSPIIQADLLRRLNNNFVNQKVRLLSKNTIAFVASSKTITDSSSGFVTAKFTANTHILVEDSLSNNGIYKIATVAAGTITLDDAETLIDESAEEYVTLTRVDFPVDLQLPFARLIWHEINNRDTAGIQAEKTGNYSATYSADVFRDVLRQAGALKYRRVGFA